MFNKKCQFCFIWLNVGLLADVRIKDCCTNERGNASKLMLILDLLCFICDRTKCPAAKADINDNSAAKTVPQIIFANSHELLAGFVGEQPFTPRSYSNENWIEINLNILCLSTKNKYILQDKTLGLRELSRRQLFRFR